MGWGRQQSSEKQVSKKNYSAQVSIAGDLKASFKNAFIGATGAVAKLKGEVQKLSRAKKEIEAFQKAAEKVKKFKDALEEAKSKLAEAQRALASAEKPTSKLTRAADAAARKVKSLDASLKKEAETLTLLSSKLHQAGIKTSDLARHEARLQRQIERRGKIIARQRRAEQGYSSARSKLGSSVATFGIFAASAVALFAPMIKAAAEFETKLESIKKTANFSEEEGRGLKQTIEGLVFPTNRSETELLGSAEQMAADGAKLDQIKGSLKEIARASVATGTSMEDLTKASLAFQNNMGIAASDSKAAFGIIATGAKAGAFEIQDMAKSLPTVLAQGSAIGLKGKTGLASTVAALEIARRGAGTNDEAANNVRNLLAKINAPETVKRFKEVFGVDWEKESKAAVAKGLDPLIYALDRIQEITKGDSFKRGKLFGDMQVNAALTPLLNFRKDFDKIREEALAGEDLIDIDFAKTITTWPELINGMKNAVAQLSRMAGDELLPTVKELFVSVAKTINKVVLWRKENPKLFSNIVKGAAAIAAMTAAALALGVAVKAAVFAWSGLSLVFTSIGTIVAGLSAPVVAVVAVIAAAALTVRKYWEPISAFFSGVWKGISEGWNSAGGGELWEKIKEAFGIAKTAILDFLEPVKLTPEEFKKCFESGEKVGKFIGETLVFLINGAIGTVDSFAQVFKGLWTAIEWTFNKISAFIGPWFADFDKRIKPFIDRISKFSSAIQKGFNSPAPGYQGGNFMLPGGGGLPKLDVPPVKAPYKGSQNIFNINTLPGQSPEAISESVIRKLQQMQDQQRRGSHWDGGGTAFA